MVERAVTAVVPLRRSVVKKAHARKPSRRRRVRSRTRIELWRQRDGLSQRLRSGRVRRRRAAAGAAACPPLARWSARSGVTRAPLRRGQGRKGGWGLRHEEGELYRALELAGTVDETSKGEYDVRRVNSAWGMDRQERESEVRQVMRAGGRLGDGCGGSSFDSEAVKRLGGSSCGALRVRCVHLRREPPQLNTRGCGSKPGRRGASCTPIIPLSPQHGPDARDLPPLTGLAVDSVPTILPRRAAATLACVSPSGTRAPVSLAVRRP